jgi:hypothetical protein
MRNALRISHALGARLGAMKDRFPLDRRPAWRQRFLAIARELESAAPRREAVAVVRAARRKFLEARTLRGVRLACVRAS